MKPAHIKTIADIGGIVRSIHPLPIKEAMTGLLTVYGREDLLLFSKIMKQWRFIVNEPLCDHIRPLRIENGALHVTAVDPAYGSAISYHKHTILSYIRVTLQSNIIRTIVFRPETTFAHQKTLPRHE